MPTFSTSFTPPGPPPDFTLTADTVASRVMLEWGVDGALAAPDFVAYNVYRSTDGGATWVQVASIGVQATTTYDDYEAPLDVPLLYRVTQVSIDFEGDPAEGSTELDIHEWWVVTPGYSEQTFRLHVVDDYDDIVPVEQEEYTALGRRTKIQVQGEVLGTEGSIRVHVGPEHRGLRDLLVRALGRQANEYVLLKTPFGDVWRVRLGSIRRRRRPAGHSEITFPFTEVA